MRAQAIAAAAGFLCRHISTRGCCAGHAVTETAHWLEWQNWADLILQQPYELKDGWLNVPDVPGVGH